MARYTEVQTIEPIFISVAEAAKVLGVGRETMYELCAKQKVASQYIGKRRLVSVASLREFAENLPTVPEEPVA